MAEPSSSARATYGSGVEVSGPSPWKSVAFNVTVAVGDDGQAEAELLLVREVERQTGSKVEFSELRVERRGVRRLGSETRWTTHLHTEGVLVVRDE